MPLPKGQQVEAVQHLRNLIVRCLRRGQKQRLAVATALLSEKPVLIFDEPTSGLDYARMVEVSGVIRSLARHERIVLVVTHDQEFMQRACDRVLRL